MEVIENKRTVRRWVRDRHAQGESVALVPTMGNLHQGHLALIQKAGGLANRVIASIYVNPAQFGEGEDFDRYPRTPKEDLEKLEREDCDLVFLPSDSEIYPFGFREAVKINASPELAKPLEGVSRPGHFDGVVTIVARLFAIVNPDFAVFGEKDYQQLLVIRRMSEDLGFGIEIVGAKTVRDKSGLALSSRNKYLDSNSLEAAESLNRILRKTAHRASKLAEPFGRLESEAAEALEASGLKVDYVAIRSAGDLSIPGPINGELRILAAVKCGDTRLIDNMAVSPAAHE